MLARLVAIGLLAVSLTGCAATMAYHKAQDAAKRTDWDAAVAHYRTAVQEAPDRPEYRIALERAMLEAALMHTAVARDFETKGQLDAAAREYRRASEYDPANRQLAFKVSELDRRILDQIETSRPRPKIDEMRERARRMSPAPVLNPASREPLDIHFNGSVRDLLKFIADSSGINITFTSDYRDPPLYNVQLTGVTLEQALQQVLSANGLFYKVLNERTVLVIPDNAQNRSKYEEQVIRTFFLSHADATEMVQLLNTIMRVPGVPLVPAFVPNKTQNSVTIRASAPLVAIAERLIEANDRPRAEILLDVQILEVSRTRAKQFGLDLSQYSLTAIFSPEVAPTTTTGTSGTTTTVPPFNLNTISRGISAADFYLAVPSAIVRFLESDSQTKLVAKPQLRGQEGQKISLNLGDQIPVATTTFGSTGGTGSLATTPVSAYNYKDVGINVIVTPRVTFEGDVILELSVENSAVGADVNIAGQNFPSFASRKVETKIRLRDGESTLLAGLLREDERRIYRGLPGLIHIPFVRQLFTSNDLSNGQTDIVMLLTPRIVRGHELTQQDVDPVYIGSQQHLGLTGPPPLIAAPETAPGTPAPAEPVPPPNGQSNAPPGPSFPPGTTLSQPGILPQTPPPPAPQPPPPQATTPNPSQAAPATPETPTEVPPAAPPETATGTAPATASAPSSVQMLVTPPGPEFRMGGGPYTVPISVTNSPRVSTLTVTLTYDPAVLKVRSVQEGSFMRQGGVSAQFTRQVDPTAGRVDVSIVRNSDVVGASGSGLVAAVLFDPVAPGASAIGASGAASGPGGAPVTVGVTPTRVTVK
jgi:type II secretory pathway component GspD/PulD (secretin)